MPFSPARLSCTTWMFNCKEPVSIHSPAFVFSFDVSLYLLNLPALLNSTFIGSECSSYILNKETDRSVLFPKFGYKCDTTLVTAWYRFNSTAGTKMPTTCVSKNKCNTHATGWLNGTHPTPQEGIVNRRVCFHWNSNCCNWAIKIKVRNCGLFYVYRLVNPAICQLRYCVTNWERQEQIIHSLNSPLQKLQGNFTELAYAKISGIVNGDAPVSYWSIFFPIPSDGSRSLCESWLEPLYFSFLKWRMECLLSRLTVNIVQLT